MNLTFQFNFQKYILSLLFHYIDYKAQAIKMPLLRSYSELIY